MTRIRTYSLLIALLTLLAPGATPSRAASVPAPAEPALTIRLYAIDPEAVPYVPRAIEEADRVFQKAGLQVRWLECHGAERDAACDDAPGKGDIRLRILPGKGQRELGDALGYALALQQGVGVYATAFFGAVSEVRRGTLASTAQVLGHVIAHEVGHLLLGDVHHSRKGLMSASWKHGELMSIARREMNFSGPQIRRIRAGARTRMVADDAMVALAVPPGPSGLVSAE
jgi:hypothetical protein